MVDARLPDGSRLNAIIPPLALDGPSLTIRRFGSKPLTLEDLLRFGAFTPEMVMLLEGAIKARLNIIISRRHRLRQNDAAQHAVELHSSTISASSRSRTRPNCSSSRSTCCGWKRGPPNIEGKGAITATDLVKNALRMRPDRIIIGECRGAETLDMLQAMNTGHEGSMTTIHANTPRDAVARLETMITHGRHRAAAQGHAAAVRRRPST